MKKNSIIVAIAILIALFAGVFLMFPRIIHENGDISWPWAQPDTSTVKMGDKTFFVEVVDTSEGRNKGLSSRENLAKYDGMLFVFEKSAIHPFWMKDMKFPLDIIWIGENLRVVYIKEDATLESYPDIFTPDANAMYVVEINAGTVADRKIKIGEKIILNISNKQ